MAWYTSTILRYRGRLISVTERYGVFMSAHVIKGKPLCLKDEDLLRIEKLSSRGEARKDLDTQAEAICDPCFFCERR
jgi:hypothetical protein